jgi:hypothetical protein
MRESRGQEREDDPERGGGGERESKRKQVKN